MPKAHTRPWHRLSVFGDGPRRPLDREQRARFRYLLNAHRRARRLTPCGELVGNALVRRLSGDGHLDPSHDRTAEDVGCCARTVRRALVTLKSLGLLVWQRRIVRTGHCVDQTSNSYVLVAPDGNPSGGQNGRQTRRKVFVSSKPTDLTRQEALKALAVIAARRMRELGLG